MNLIRCWYFPRQQCEDKSLTFDKTIRPFRTVLRNYASRCAPAGNSRLRIGEVEVSLPS